MTLIETLDDLLQTPYRRPRKREIENLLKLARSQEHAIDKLEQKNKQLLSVIREIEFIKSLVQKNNIDPLFSNQSPHVKYISVVNGQMEVNLVFPWG